ncbi:MAG TPA: ester cyclase [Nitrososphaerales archaeon]|nr:ester cyclase [Nitrososphaerales archaeon]
MSSTESEKVKKNKAIVLRFIEEVQSQHKLDVADVLMDRNMVDHYFEMRGLPEPADAVKAFKEFYSKNILSAFPDAKAVVHEMVAEGDLVATYKTTHVTHTGEFRGIAPTGKEGDIQIMDIFRIAEEKKVEHWGIVDFTSITRKISS